MTPPAPSRSLVGVALVALTCALPLAGRAQSVRASLSGADTVRQGERLVLTFGLEDVEPGGFPRPELVGLTVVGGPSRRSRVSIVNGVRRSAFALSYYVVAEQPGLGYVAPLAIPMADGDTLRTEPLRVFITDDPDYVPLERAPVAEPARPRRPTVKM